MAASRALRYLYFTLVPILLIQEEERHSASVTLPQGILHQKLCLAHHLLLLAIFGIHLDDFKDEALHGYGHTGARLVTHELELGEVKAVSAMLVDGFLLLLRDEQRSDLAHDQLIDPQKQVLVLHLPRLLIELHRRLKADLLHSVLFSFGSLHAHFKNLAFVCVERLVCHRTKGKLLQIVRDLIVRATKTIGVVCQLTCIFAAWLLV